MTTTTLITGHTLAARHEAGMRQWERDHRAQAIADQVRFAEATRWAHSEDAPPPVTWRSRIQHAARGVPFARAAAVIGATLLLPHAIALGVSGGFVAGVIAALRT